MILPLIAQAAPAGQTAAPTPGGMDFLMPIVFMFAIMYFLIIRPQQKKQKELNKQISSLKTGDKVITSGGMHGIVTNVKESTLYIKIADNTKVEFEKTAVVSILRPETEPATAASK